jgi:hypothetical protein
MRRRRPHNTVTSSLVLLAALVVSGILVAASPTSAGNVSPPALAAVALQEATGAGDGGVHSADVVLTTRQQAEALLGAGIVSNERVYLVEIQGHFTLFDASPPLGAPPPQGDYLTFTFDPTTNLVPDLGLSDRSVDLSALEAVTVLHL